MATSQIHSEMINYSSQDGALIRGYLSHPTAPGAYPGIVVIMEAFGLVEHIMDVARRFAAQGYVTLAPDLFSRGGPLDPTNLEQVMGRMRALPDSEAVADLNGAARYLKGLKYCAGKIGAIGWCSGGRHTLLFACNTVHLNAAIDCYGGRVVTEELSSAQPKAVVDMIATLSCPLLGLFGEEDTNPTVEHVRRLEGELKKYKKTYEIKSYPNAGHGFFADPRPSYRPEAAADAWGRMLSWYGKYLKS